MNYKFNHQSFKPTVLLAAAGTAGHINPALATAKLLNERNIKTIFLGCDGIENDLVMDAGYDILHIKKTAVMRSFLQMYKNLSLPYRFLKEVKKIQHYIRDYKIDVVVGFGGYVSAPAYIAAHRENIDIIIHEQNSHIGMANKLGSKYAKLFAYSFPDTNLTKIDKNVNKQYFGLPMRKTESLKDCNIRFPQNQLKNVLIFGGSLGAQRINQTIAESYRLFERVANVIHITGKSKSSVYQNVHLSPQHKYYEYSHNIPELISDADLIISRSGAATCHEIAAHNKPAILIPLPIGNGEQWDNAKLLKDGAIIVNDDSFTDNFISSKVIPLLKDDTKLKQMGEQSGVDKKLDAAYALSKTIANYAYFHKLNSYKKSHFMAISGAGISPIASCFKKFSTVSGCDSVTIGHSSKHLEDSNANVLQDVVIYSSAIKDDNLELKKAYELSNNNKLDLLHRSDALNALLNLHSNSIAVAGSHGKTTITAMLSTVLDSIKPDESSFVIGAKANINGVDTDGGKLSLNSKYIAIEADESDASFVKYHPDVAIISNIDPDHLDFYGSFDNVKDAFAKFANNSQNIVISKSAYSLLNDRIDKDKNVIVVEDFNKIELSVPGYYNQENAQLALNALTLFDLDTEKIKNALSSFKGASRRFEVHKIGDYEIVDDYAHHPVEVKNLINAAKSKYYGKNIVVLFQPHLFSRTANFAKDFANEIVKADKGIITKIYGAREIQEQFLDVSPKIISKNKRSLLSTQTLEEGVAKSIFWADELAKKNNNQSVILSVGAGDSLVGLFRESIEK